MISEILQALRDFWSIKFGASFPTAPLDKSKLGVNCFFNTPRIGAQATQGKLIAGLGINHTRVLFSYTTEYHVHDSAQINFDFWDSVLAAQPPGAQVLAVLVDVPDWAFYSRGGSIESTVSAATRYLEWVRNIVRRYRGRIWGYQIWNEPNMDNGVNQSMGVTEPEVYVELLKQAFSIIRAEDPQAHVVSAATTPLTQSYPAAKNYFKKAQSLGLSDYCDFVAVHSYGAAWWHWFRPYGAKFVLNAVPKPLIMTETGIESAAYQAKYAHRWIPLYFKHLPGLMRVYWYQFDGQFEVGEPDKTFGLLATDGLSVASSSLYDELAT